MDKLKEATKQHYGAIASSAVPISCCGGSSCGGGDDEVTFMLENYSPDKLGELAIADLGLGCGTPTAYARLERGMTVVDLGSGAGIDAFISSQEVGEEGRVIGVDMTPEMIDRARANAVKLGTHNVEFRHGDIEALPIESESVDRILSNCVLNLVPDKPKAFAEMFRVLRKGGIFVVSDIVTRGSLSESIRSNPELWAGCVAGAIEEGRYLELLRDAGFSLVEVIKASEISSQAATTTQLVSVTVRGIK